MKYYFATLLLALSLVGAKAQQNQVKLHVEAADTAGMQVYLYAIDGDDQYEPMAQEGLTLKQEIAPSKQGLYSLVYVSTAKQAQYSTPLYFDGAVPSELSLQMTDGCPQVTVLPASKKKADKVRADGQNEVLAAIHAYNQVYFRQSQDVWTKAPSMTPDDLRQMLKAYDEALANVNGTAGMGEAMKAYMDVWNYLLKNEVVTVYNRSHKDASLDMKAELGCEAAQKLDTPMALLHNGVTNTALQDVPRGTLESRLSYISSHYKTETMRDNIAGSALSAFIRSYNFEKGYQDGLAMLEAARQKTGMEIVDSYIAKFKERVSAIPGAAFPDVALIDADGNAVSLSKFKGKYVYIDLWASWCVPCIKEVPYLQELEKQLQNPNVVFVSISTDSTEKPWRSRMEQQKMHGNQWLNTDGKLCDRLNVSGIPHFLIYDKEGHLLVYDAPRPSTGEQLKKMLEELK